MVDEKQVERGRKIHEVLLKASEDDVFKKALKEDPQGVFKKAGVDIHENCLLEIVENSAQDFHLTVPATKYPSELELNILPKRASLDQIIRWIVTQVQSNSVLKEQILANAEDVLKKQGAKIPEGMKIHVHENSDKIHYFIVPRNETDDEELSDLELQVIAGGAANNAGVAQGMVFGNRFGLPPGGGPGPGGLC